MDKHLKLKIALNDELKKIASHERTYNCLIPDCSASATTTSHVLQQSMVLESILDKTGHFYSIKRNDLFKMGPEGPLKFVKSSLTNTFKYPLYCNSHDDSIFSSIEKSHPVNWENRQNALLQTYRTICMEIRKKELYLDCMKSIAKNRKEILGTFDYFDMRPAELSIKDMSFFKAEIEEEIFSKDSERFNINVIYLPKKNLCFSSAISINDPNNPKSQETDAWGYTKQEPITSSFLNFFPYFNHSILIAVQHHDYPCRWTEKLLEQIINKQKYDKLLSDLLTYRIEEWAISSDLYNGLSEEKKIEFLNNSVIYSDYFEFNLNTDFNLFEN